MSCFVSCLVFLSWILERGTKSCFLHLMSLSWSYVCLMCLVCCRVSCHMWCCEHKALNVEKILDFHSSGREVLHSLRCTPLASALDRFQIDEARKLAAAANYALRYPSGLFPNPNPVSNIVIQSYLYLIIFVSNKINTLFVSKPLIYYYPIWLSNRIINYSIELSKYRGWAAPIDPFRDTDNVQLFDRNGDNLPTVIRTRQTRIRP